MRLVDRLLKMSKLLDTIYEARRTISASRRRGREQTPAEVVLRLHAVEHIRTGAMTRGAEVRANLVYRLYADRRREGGPMRRPLARLGQLIGPEVIEELHQRIVQLAQE